MNKGQTPPQKPLALLHEEAENIIFNAVSMAAKLIPFYLLEGIMTNLLHQVREKAREEREGAARLYEKQLAEYEEAEKEDTNG